MQPCLPAGFFGHGDACDAAARCLCTSGRIETLGVLGDDTAGTAAGASHAQDEALGLASKLRAELGACRGKAQRAAWAQKHGEAAAPILKGARLVERVCRPRVRTKAGQHAIRGAGVSKGTQSWLPLQLCRHRSRPHPIWVFRDHTAIVEHREDDLQTHNGRLEIGLEMPLLRRAIAKQIIEGIHGQCSAEAIMIMCASTPNVIA